MQSHMRVEFQIVILDVKSDTRKLTPWRKLKPNTLFPLERAFLFSLLYIWTRNVSRLQHPDKEVWCLIYFMTCWLLIQKKISYAIKLKITIKYPTLIKSSFCSAFVTSVRKSLACDIETLKFRATGQNWYMLIPALSPRPTNATKMTIRKLR